jgi:hypothetical protein
MKGKSIKNRTALRVTSCIAVLLGAVSLSTIARAEYVQCETPFTQGAPLQSLLQGSTNVGSSFHATQVVWGASLAVNALSLPGAGTLTVKLADIKWTETLQSLSLLVTDLDNVWQRLDGAGNLLVNVSGPTKLFVAVFARSADGSVGLYNIQTSFAPVPLPAAGWLLLSGLGGLGALRRKRKAAQAAA